MLLGLRILIFALEISPFTKPSFSEPRYPIRMDKRASLEALNKRMLAEVSCNPPESPPVAGAGNPDSPVMFIGHNPSGTDTQTGRPYTGPAGEIFDELLAQAGFSRDDVYITNLVKCWLRKEENGIKVNRTPTAKEIKSWVPAWLKPEIDIIQPKAIVCLGGPTAQHFLGKDFKITLQGGKWLEVPPESPYLKLAESLPSPKPLIMGIPQPSYLIHIREHSPESYPAARANMVADLLKVEAVLEGKVPNPAPSLPGVDIPF